MRLTFGDTRLLALAAGAIAVGVVLFLNASRKQRKRKKLPYKDESDTVYVVQIPRGKKVPSPSPFPIKLETYLRIAKIPYENVFARKFSSKGKIPWIRHRGKDVPDSQFAIEYLNEQFNVDLEAHLTKEERAMSRAFLKMVEENLYWALACYRFIHDDVRKADYPSVIPTWALLLFGRRIKKYAWGQGMGRHSVEEIFHITKLDFEAISDYLGDKKFLFGDKPCVADCAVFGMLVQVVFNQTYSPHNAMIKSEFPNLERFCWTMRNAFWPDWDQILAKA